MSTPLRYGREAAAIGPAGTVTAADISADMLDLTRAAGARAGAELRVVREDATALSLPDPGLARAGRFSFRLRRGIVVARRPATA